MTEFVVRIDSLTAKTDIACLKDLRTSFDGTGLQKDRFINKTVLLGIGESILPARVKPGGGDFEVLSGSDVGVFESSQMFLGIIFTIKAIIKIKVVGIEDYYAILETGHKELYAYWLCCR